MTSLRLLVVDDEPLIRSGIRAILSRMPEIEIVGECANGAEAIAAIRRQTLDLVLLDVRMPDISGLDVVRRVGPERMPLVIFITAYDEYAVGAFELNAVDYLLKPFDEERLLRAVEKARDRLAANTHSALVERLRALLDQRERKWPERIAVKNKDAFEMVTVDSIDWIESADNYVELHCGSKVHLLGETMRALEQKLDPSRFVRVHRRHIVNVARIAAIHPMLNGAYEIHLQSGERVSSGRRHKDAVLALIGRAN